MPPIGIRNVGARDRPESSIKRAVEPRIRRRGWVSPRRRRARERALLRVRERARASRQRTNGPPALPALLIDSALARPAGRRLRTGGAAPQRDGLDPRGMTLRPSPEDPVADRPTDPALDRDFARDNGWDADFETYTDFELPTYVGPTTFMNLPWITDPAQLLARSVDVAVIGAPFDDAVSHRPGARFGPRAIREAQYTSGSVNSLQLGVEPFELLTVVDAGDANVIPAWIERAHALIYRKVREVAATGAIPIVLGGDHSITWPSATAVAEIRRPGRIGIVHFDAHADTAADDWGVLAGHGTPMRRLIESGAVAGRSEEHTSVLQS